MANLVSRIVFFPRFSSLVGPSAEENVFHTSPFQARAFSTLVAVPFWIGTTQGGEYSFDLEGSPDLVSWVDLGQIAANGGVSPLEDLALDVEWLRVRATLTEERFTCWMVGEFLLRAG